MFIEAPADVDNFLFFRAASALTVTRVDCIVGAATSVVITVQECDANGANCQASAVGSGTCSTTNTVITGSNLSIVSGNWLRVDVGTVTGTPGQVNVCVTVSQ
jgi:hypothetical protein